MKKRIIGLLLALLLMCASAAAEDACVLTLSIEADAEAAKLILAPETDNDRALVDKVCQLLNSVQVQATIQEDGGYVKLMVGEENVIDLGVTGEYLTSNFLPEYRLMLDAGDVLGQAESITAQTDWMSVLIKGLSALDEWFGKIEFTREEGTFDCDAYGGAEVVYSAAFDDAQVASLMNGLLACLPEDIQEMAKTDRWSVLNGTVAEKNTYAYVFKRAYAADDETMLGMTLQVLEDGQQVMRYSLGFADNGMRLVWGYGLNGVNHYMDMMLLDGTSPSEKEYMLAIYQDPERVGFSGVDQQLDRLLVMYAGLVQVDEQDGHTSWRAEMEVIEPDALLVDTLFVLEGSANGAGTVQQELTYYVTMDQEKWTRLATVRADAAPGEKMVLSAEGLTDLDLSDDEDMADFENLLDDAALKLTLKLFKLVPSELIMYFME